MAFAAPSYREHAPALPRIIGPGDAPHHHDAMSSSSMSRSFAMSIPGRDSRINAPPPLPPPQFPLGNPAHQHPHHHHPQQQHSHQSRRPFESGSNYGSLMSSFDDHDRPNYKRRDDHQDEGYVSMSATDRSRDSSLHAGFGLHHNKFSFRSTDLDGDSLKKKLDPIRTSDRSPPRSLLSSSMNGDLLARSPDARLRPTLSMPVQLPIHSRGTGVLESPGRFTDTPVYSPVSGPSFQSDLDRSPRHHLQHHHSQRRRNNSDDATSTQGSYDYDDMDMDDGPSLKRLHNDDAYSAGGSKRRAPSPADEHMHGVVPGPSDLVRRRGDMGSRGSPRLSTIPQGSSMTAASRSNSYMSTASTATTASTSLGRRSPVAGFSPGGMSPTCSSPYATPISLNPSPRASISGRSAAHHSHSHSRQMSGAGVSVSVSVSASPRKPHDLQKPGSKLQGFYMCECCPKKPKKFETADELSAHEAEKQYECTFCGNRFKNKNEAERHQNSLHVRRHSWSCSALSNYDRAFHESTSRPGEADSCGYCGDEFPRSGRGPGTGALSGGLAPRHVTDEDWEERVRHLQEVHKFRECNSGKKFYRADHFRQHLKHSHAGTSGKWTNMLENACMLEEDPPVPR